MPIAQNCWKKLWRTPELLQIVRTDLKKGRLKLASKLFYFCVMFLFCRKLLSYLCDWNVELRKTILHSKKLQSSCRKQVFHILFFINKQNCFEKVFKLLFYLHSNPEYFLLISICCWVKILEKRVWVMVLFWNFNVGSCKCSPSFTADLQSMYNPTFCIHK